MEPQEERIHLDAESGLLPTNDPNATYYVESGTVFVYIARLEAGLPHERLHLCDVSEGHQIPSFSYRETEERQEWRFFLAASEKADLIVKRGWSTNLLKKRFASSAGIGSSDSEGFERTVLNFYKRKLLKDSVYISRNRKNEVVWQNKAGDLISGAFRNEERVIGDDPLYRAVAAACKRCHIFVIDAARLASICKEEITLRAIADASGFAFREVVLQHRWYQKDCGILISTRDGEPVSLVPKGPDSYWIYYGVSGKREVLTQAVAETIEPRAFCICRTLPPHSLKKKDLFRFALGSVRRPDLIAVLLLTLLSALIGILIPTLNRKIYDDYIPLGDINQLVQICAVIAAFMLGDLFFGMVKNLSQDRISSRVGYDMQNAVYYRVFRLPESFMRRFESADMAQRLSSVRGFIDTYADAFLLSGLGALFSLLYLYRMFRYAKKLAWIAVLMLVVYLAVVAFAASRTIRSGRKFEEKRGEASAKLYQYLNGVDKIRLAGAEERAVFQYYSSFSESVRAQLSMGKHSAFITVMSGISATIFSMVFYYIIVKKNVSLTTGSFMAFNSAFGSFSAAFMQLVKSFVSLYELKPQYERIAPVFEAAEEDMRDSEVPGVLTGGVSLKNVRFSYVENGPVVLNGIDIEIKPGEYIGIVGASGCGKSTLLKLLLGFETPTTGVVCYDGKDIRALDKRRLRKNLGVVLQNGQLISGSIYENITITCPAATRADVIRVIEAVGLKHDIEQMPMGLETVLSETSGTISGGQKQRILIARAIIGKPAVLIFDEATSALDNLTQAEVSKSLDAMKVTRIVVAHRLSTIKNCDRILVLDQGKIVEEGNYSALMSHRGLFYQLASRQMVD